MMLKLTDQEKILNKKLIHLVRSRGLSCTVLSIATGQKKPNISNWMGGKLLYSFKTLEKIADTLSVDLKIILNEK